VADEIHPQVRIVVQPYASALPLGFLAFGIGMFLLAATGTGWVDVTQAKPTGLLLVSFVFPLEFLACVIAFLARDSASAASLGVFAGSWAAVGGALIAGTPGELSPALGYYLIAFAIVVVLLGIAALFGKPMIAILLFVAAVRAALGAVYELGGGTSWQTAGGWVALGIFVVAMYGGLAFLLEEGMGKTVLPLWRKGGAREAIEGGLGPQLQRLESEAGVRHTL